MDGVLDGILVISASLGFVVLIWYVGYRLRRRRTQWAGNANQSVDPPTPPALTLTEDEQFAQEAAEVRHRWERERQAVERAHEEEMRAINERLQKARQLVDRSGVGSAACDAFRIMQHWPSWSKLDDWQMPLQIEGLDGGDLPSQENGRRKGQWIGWAWKQSSYRLELNIGPSYGMIEDNIGDLCLFVNKNWSCIWT
jgi:hypothetical protein